jgi:N6-adenosine-specific RNA methylase IME4
MFTEATFGVEKLMHQNATTSVTSPQPEAIRIDAELQRLIPPLAPEELAGLESDLLREGCRDALVVWLNNGDLILLDGHNRYEICTRHKIAYRTVEKEFRDREAAMLWVIDNQAHRRNLADIDKIALQEKREGILKNLANRNLRTRTGGMTRAKLPKSQRTVNTRRESAKAAGVGERTYDAGKLILEAVRTGEVSGEVMDKLRAGETSIHRVANNIKDNRKRAALKSYACVEPDGTYEVIVVDPPWPMEKIERDCRPNQTKALDYSTMSLDAIGELKIPAAEDCHLWLWTTQRFLPEAFPILDKWGFRYVCCFTWCKPGGFQPVGLPQFSSEFVLYARKGSPVFSSTKGLSTWFQGPRGKHSEKPEEFYDMVRRCTVGRRLDVFSRREIEGFDGWGLEYGKTSRN